MLLELGTIAGVDVDGTRGLGGGTGRTDGLGGGRGLVFEIGDVGDASEDVKSRELRGESVEVRSLDIGLYAALLETEVGASSG